MAVVGGSLVEEIVMQNYDNALWFWLFFLLCVGRESFPCHLLGFCWAKNLQAQVEYFFPRKVEQLSFDILVTEV